MTSTSIRTFGTDVSKWQDNNYTPQGINFNTMRANGVEFVFIKASQNVTEDEDFKYNWKASKAAGLRRGAYHFYEYRYEYQKSAEQQANRLLEIMDGDFGELGLVLDYERPNSTWPPLPAVSTSLHNIYTFMYTIEKYTKEDTIFYSNLDFIRNYLGYSSIPSWLSKKPLWLALYPFVLFDYIPPLWYTLPTFPWKIYFWQFTDRLNGIKYGAESTNLDGDFFLGTKEELYKFREREDYTVFLPGIIKPPEESEEVEKVRVLTDTLRIRTAPSISATITGYLRQGDMPEKIEEKVISDREIWVRIGWKQWSAKVYSGVKYMEDV